MIFHRYWSHGPIEIVDLPSCKMVDLSSSQSVNFKRLPEITINYPIAMLVYQAGYRYHFQTFSGRVQVTCLLLLVVFLVIALRRQAEIWIFAVRKAMVMFFWSKMGSVSFGEFTFWYTLQKKRIFPKMLYPFWSLGYVFDMCHILRGDLLTKSFVKCVSGPNTWPDLTSIFRRR